MAFPGAGEGCLQCSGTSCTGAEDAGESSTVVCGAGVSSELGAVGLGAAMVIGAELAVDEALGDGAMGDTGVLSTAGLHVGFIAGVSTGAVVGSDAGCDAGAALIGAAVFCFFGAGAESALGIVASASTNSLCRVGLCSDMLCLVLCL